METSVVPAASTSMSAKDRWDRSRAAVRFAVGHELEKGVCGYGYGELEKGVCGYSYGKLWERLVAHKPWQRSIYFAASTVVAE